VHRTRAVTFDPVAAHAWLQEPSTESPDLTRAESLGIDDEMTDPGVGGFLAAVDDVLAAQPGGLHRRGDITGVELWLIHDGAMMEEGGMITVDLANGLRLSTLYQDIKDFADRGQRGIPAVLCALDHIADQASLVVATYQAAHPDYSPEPAVSR
jgi:hypothetical protein